VFPEGFFPGVGASSGGSGTAIHLEAVVPEVIEVPATGTLTYVADLFVYGSDGTLTVPDSAPTVALINQAAADKSSRLGSTTMTLVETGRYRVVYTSTSGDATEQLVWTFAADVGSVTYKVGANSEVFVQAGEGNFVNRWRRRGT
jgi:hypothetical protein